MTAGIPDHVLSQPTCGKVTPYQLHHDLLGNYTDNVAELAHDVSVPSQPCAIS
jgi:hypothetical protein